ncbi:MICAL2 [Acrasis kona]|uniref:MICAL2 n=1 Tax=Acrasis kona TaxID=1008807 RepID=A0AAW2YSU1_9EUKA
MINQIITILILSFLVDCWRGYDFNAIIKNTDRFHPYKYSRDLKFKRDVKAAFKNSRHDDEVTRNYFKQIQKLITRRSFAKNEKNETTLIIGAGPVGLLAALEKYVSGEPHIILAEKRNDYERNVWFDLYPEPYSPAFNILYELGFGSQQIEFQSQKMTNGSAITIRCQLLERFLSKILFVLSILDPSLVLLYGFELTSVLFSPRSVVLKSLVDGRILVPFHRLIACDGYNSRTRFLLKIPTKVVDEFTIFNHKVHIKNLHQVSVIVGFKPTNSSSSCPELRADPFNPDSTIDPWMPGFMVNGISSIFKRFYHGHCHMQILLNKVFGEKFLINSHVNVDWVTILQMVNTVMKHPYTNVEQLKRSITTKTDGSLDLVILKSQILKSDDNHYSLGSGSSLTLRGDASANAHFRLGVGVNTAFISYRYHTSQNLSRYLREEYVRKQWEAVVNNMVGTMFLETYCNYVIFMDKGERGDRFDKYEPGKMIVYERDFKNLDYVQVKERQVTKCIREWTQ